MCDGNSQTAGMEDYGVGAQREAPMTTIHRARLRGGLVGVSVLDARAGRAGSACLGLLKNLCAPSVRRIWSVA